MNTELERFRDHAHAMAKPGAHLDDCHATRTTARGVKITNYPDPACLGCVPDGDRRLFARLANEIDAYLDDLHDEPLEGLG
jgi:hypothetical protein